MEASDTGVWIMCITGDRKGKIDFYYHDKIIKIEEAGKIDLNELESDQKNEIKTSIKKYEEKRKKEIEMYNEGFETPDIKDPKDQEGINTMLDKVQKMVLENKKIQENNPGDFLEKRKKPE